MAPPSPSPTANVLTIGRYLGAALRKRHREHRLEHDASYPYDQLVPGAHRTSTMATTIDAPPEAVWPWLVQMGCNRAGWYSHDSLDNGGKKSAAEIIPRFQNLRQGDRIDATPDGRLCFIAEVVEPCETLVLRSSISLRGRSFDPSHARRPRYYVDGTWAFHLRAEEGTSRTRLVVRCTQEGRPRWLLRLLAPLGGLAHLIMQEEQFANLKSRATRHWLESELRRISERTVPDGEPARSA